MKNWNVSKANVEGSNELNYSEVKIAYGPWKGLIRTAPDKNLEMALRSSIY